MSLFYLSDIARNNRKGKVPDTFPYTKIRQRLLFQFREMVLPILFPRRCPVCKKILSQDILICSKCRSSLPFIVTPVCYLCGKPVSSPCQELCFDCRNNPRSFHHGISLFLYNEKTQPMMADFKYHNRRTLSRYFAEEILIRYHNLLVQWRPQLIIPVPVHIKKLNRRGYNQAALLARDLSVLSGIPYFSDVLIRTADTPPQKTLSPQARLDNLQSAFLFNRKYAELPRRIQTVLLVDDIYTTGATMETCTRVLTKAGFSNVCICTVCTGVSRD